MANGIYNINKPNAGTCPHGCAPSACPICSGMGGGGMRAGERAQKPGEMSYHECAIIGAMMRAREAAQKEHENNLKLQAEAAQKFQQAIQNASARIADFLAKISNITILKPVAFVVKSITLPILNIINTVFIGIQNIINKLSQIKIDIQDKLNAIFGEAKAFINKKVSELVSMLKTKFKSIFKIFESDKSKDDEKKIDEDKKIFRLKTFIHKILKRNNDSETKSRS